MNVEIRDLKVRRNERFEAIKCRIDDFKDDAKYYKNNSSKKLVEKVYDLFKKHTQQEHIGIDGLPYTSFLDIKQNKRDEFIENIIENLREANENWIEKDLADVEKDLTNRFINGNIEKVMEHSRQKYLTAVKSLVCLDKISKIEEMEHKLFELKKDLTSCINYNFKIENAKG